MCACSRETDRFTSLSSTNARSLRRRMPPSRYTSTSRPRCTRALSIGSSGTFALPFCTTRWAGFPDPPACSCDPAATVSHAPSGSGRPGAAPTPPPTPPRARGRAMADGGAVYLHAQPLGKPHGIRAQLALNFVLQVAAEEAAAEHRGPALLHAAHADADKIEREHHARAGAIGGAPNLFKHGQADIGQLARAL